MSQNWEAALSKILIGERLNIAASVTLAGSAILGMISGRAFPFQSMEDAAFYLFTDMWSGNFVVISEFLAFVAFVFNALGTRRASADESAFQNALFALIGGAACFFAENALVNFGAIFDVASTICDLAAAYFICKGAVGLVEKFGATTVAMGDGILKVVLVAFGAVVILTIIAYAFGSLRVATHILNGYVFRVLITLSASVGHTATLRLVSASKNALNGKL